MKPCVLLILIVCAFAAANVPLDRMERAAISDNTQETESTDTTGAETPTETTVAEPSYTICAPSTPCAWSVYSRDTKMILTNLTNSYCLCAPGADCVVVEDDMDNHSYVYCCRRPEELES